MIIATNSFDMDTIRSIVKDRGDLNEYVLGLVPDRYKHVEAIAHNTRYYLNLQISKSKEFSLQDKTWINFELTRNIHVVGYMGIYITCGELERHINMSRVEQFHKGDKYGKGC